MEEKVNESMPRFEAVYGYGQAARLLRVSTPRLKRWADGYTFSSASGPRKSSPVLQTDRFPGVVNFDELQELFFVKEYCAMGVALQHIRDVSIALAREVGTYPFATQKLLVDGKQLLIESAEGILKRPDVGQIVANFAAEHVKRLDFSGLNAKRYTPDGFSKRIYLDRGIRCGEPVTGEYAVPTRLVFTLWEAERNINAVTNYFEISEADVMAGIRFEADLRLAS